VRKQLLKLENGGIIVGRDVGNLRMFTFNPRHPLREPLGIFLEQVLTLLPEAEKERYFRQRRRPRRTGKAL